MAPRDDDILAGLLVDETQVVTVTELCRCCGVTTALVTELVAHGIVEPLDENDHEWRFEATSLRRVTTVVRLQRDLGVNLPGAALALDLLDELRELRRRG